VGAMLQIKQKYDNQQTLLDRLEQQNSELQYSNALLKAQTESSPDGILATDKQGQICSYNYRFCKMWNLGREFSDRSEIENLLISRVDLPETLMKLIEQSYENPDDMNRGEVFVDAQIFEYHISPVISDTQKFLGLLWSFRDITERKLAEV
jgi:PAS domain S-box-containing protein